MNTVAQHPFDRPVKAGELRIFGECEKPLVALVAEDLGLKGWRIVPVSSRVKPVSRREMLVGERVYQLWNAVVAPREFVEKSWIVDTLAAEDFEEIAQSIDAALPGKITEGDGEQARYERTELINVDKLSPSVDAVSSPRRKRHFFLYGAWSIAAMLMICCGIGGLWYRSTMDAIVPIASQKEVSSLAQRDGDRRVLGLEMAPTKRKEVIPPSRAELAADMDSVAIVRSPVRMRSMCGSRVPKSDGRFMRTCVPCCKGLPASHPSVCRPAAGVERYAEAGENPFTDPRVEPLSTFGLDVDTSSYTMMRRYLEDFKRLPPAESVRIEEYVNYFKFDYPEPTDETPVAIAAECGECPWNKAHKLLRLGLKAKDLSMAAAKRGEKLPPCNLTFLIDVSGSMWGENRLGLAQKGLRMLVEKMREEDHVAIVTYAGDTSVRLPATSGSHKAKINSVIDSLQSGGCTAGGAGIELAYAEAQKNFDKKANNRVILVTDGDFNVGVSGPDGLEKLIEKKRASGIFLSVFGVGEGNFQDAAMKKLADAGNGNYAYMDSVLEAKKVFHDAFAGTLYTVAKDVKLQVEFNPAEVAKYRLLGYENRALEAKDFNDDKKDAGEMGSGHTMTAFYEIIPFGTMEKGVDPLKYQKNAEKPVRPAGASDELCTVKLRWKAPDGDVSARRDLPLKASAITPAAPTEDFRFASAVAEYALLLKNSKYKGEASFTNLIERARDAKGKDREGYRAEFIRLAERAEALSDKLTAHDDQIQAEADI